MYHSLSIYAVHVTAEYNEETKERDHDYFLRNISLYHKSTIAIAFKQLNSDMTQCKKNYNNTHFEALTDITKKYLYILINRRTIS